jgi:hypothetical protein
MTQILLMINIYKLIIKIINKKEEEVDQKVLKIRRSQWVKICKNKLILIYCLQIYFP